MRAPVAHGLGLLLIAALGQQGCQDRLESLAPASYAYPASPTTGRCVPARGRVGITDGEHTPRGIVYNVRTPSNYDATIVHSLLVVYSPAGGTARGSERTTSLTRPATGAGFVVAYVDARPLSKTVIHDLATVPVSVGRAWCVDQQQIFLTGHSDGGTVAEALAILDESRDLPAGIAPSAAGFSAADLARYRCPTPLPVIVMHSARDTLFPGYGAESARWWAACNGCDPSRITRLPDGCLRYEGCAHRGPTMYCEGTGPHAAWPPLGQQLVQFFTGVGRRE